MAVLVASGLRKELSGDVLFDGVSLTVRRGDRVALAGANGAGKTTLLRAIVGETSLQGGQLSFAKDTDRAARPASAARAGSDAARVRAVRSGEHRRDRGGAARAGAGDGRRRRLGPDATALRRRAVAARACGRLGLARARGGDPARPRLRGGRSRPAARHVLRRRADTRLARACAVRRSRPVAAGRAHEPPRRRQPRVAGAHFLVGSMPPSCWLRTTAGFSR